jgi:hypothetical protein
MPCKRKAPSGATFSDRGRRINVGDNLIYKGQPIDSVRYGKVTPGNIYKSIGRRGPNIYIQTEDGAEISFKYNSFIFAE